MACLVMQTGCDSNVKQKEQEIIWGTVLFKSKLSPIHIAGIISGDLQLVGVSFWHKKAQEMNSRSYFCTVSCFHGRCLEAIKEMIKLALTGTENAIFKCGLNMKCEGHAQPECTLIPKNTTRAIRTG